MDKNTKSNPNWPSKTGNPSGGNRGNNPPRTSGGGVKPSGTPKK